MIVVNFLDERLPARFWDRVAPCPMSGCWMFFGTRNANGYGVMTMNGKFRTAHRWTYLTLVGDVPSDLDLDHLCRNRACCNPAHLEPVTRVENIRRGNTGKLQSAKTHCPQGHEYSVENTYRPLRKDGTNERQCRACNYARNLFSRTGKVAAIVAIGWSTL